MDINVRVEGFFKSLNIEYSQSEIDACVDRNGYKYESSLTVPDYYNEKLRAAEEKICRELEGVENGDVFVFLTDVHLNANHMTCIPLIREIGKRTSVGKLFCGGDHPWAFGSKEKCIAEGFMTYDLFERVKNEMKVYHARGNHDFTIRTSRETVTGYTMPYKMTRDVIMSYQSDGICLPDGDACYFYVDDAEKKIRYIVVDTCSRRQGDESTPWGTRYGFDPEQAEWLANTALSFDDGEDWSVVVVGHIACVPEIASYDESLDPLAEILKDFKNRRAGRAWDFGNAKAEFVAYLCGHNHKDMHAYVDDTLFLSTSSSATLNDDVWKRAHDTDTEALFDVFIIDKDKRTLKTVRVGAGEDREWRYGEGKE